jgi:hypothetical protein
MNVPFLVKQYLSNDLESGSFSKIFWYYPLKREQAVKGGIGMFFEVLYGDVDYEVYEQISKRFWDTFCDVFYVEDFENALRKSIQAFTQLLRGFGVEEGLDVNIVLFNALKLDDNSYQLRLISFGECDMFVIRNKKFADISKLAPQNKSLRDVKFLEVDLEEGDVLLLGNKTLLRNAFESDIIMMNSVQEVLTSLDEFKENLFGSKKLFLVAAYSGEPAEKAEDIQETAGVISKVKAFLIPVLSKGKELAGKAVETIKNRGKKPVDAEKTLGEELDLPKTSPIKRSQTYEVENLEEVVDFEGVDDVKTEGFSYATTKEEPQDVEEKFEEEAEIPYETDIQTEEVLDEIVPSVKNEDSSLEEEPELKPSKSFMPQDKKPENVNYVNEFRSNRSAIKKISNQESFKGVIGTAQNYLGIIAGFLSKLPIKKMPVSKIFVGKDKLGRPKPFWPGIIGVIVVVIGIFIFVRGQMVAAENEQKTVDQYTQAVTALQNYYNQNITRIETEDPGHYLEKCFDEVAAAESKVKPLEGIVKSEQNVKKVEEQKAKIQTIKNDCTQKYDTIYNITRVKDAELVTDLRISLGSDSDPVDMAIRQGGLVVADKGRKSIYQINPANASILKLEDPSSLISDPISVGTGESFVFACDRNNGVVYAESNEGFKRIVGLEPSSIGECAVVKGFGNNVYVTPASRNVVLRSIFTARTKSYELPTRYLDQVTDVRDFVIDGNIYVVMKPADNMEISKYFGGNKDSFALEDDINIENPISAYTNPSDSYGIYVYDKAKNQVTVIEKPTARRHPGIGVAVKTYAFENAEKFGDIKDIVVDLRDGRELNMYILSGSTIWQVRIPQQ